MGIFKAYDIRGLVPDEIDAAVARRVGYHFARRVGGKTFVVGRDMRLSSPELREALVEGIRRTGADVVDIGLVPTPVAYFAIGHLEADGGAYVTASHSPSRFNGFKLCGSEAKPIGAKTGLKEIEEDYEAHPEDPPAEGAPGELRTAEVLDAYIRHVLHFAKVDRKLTAVVDGGNGMAGVTIPRILGAFPTVRMVPLFLEPDGNFPNHEPYPLRPQNVRQLREAVLRERADLGIAFDGDADRIVFVDEEGRTVSPDLITALLARAVLADHPDTPIIYDLRSSWVVPEEIRAWRGFPIRERVGHAFIRATMRERESYFAGELSGHYYFRENYYSDCTDLAAVTILSLMCREGKKLSALVRPLRRYLSTGEMNFRVDDQEGKILEIAREFAGAKIDYLDGITVSYPTWWFNVRLSNTEPLLRLNLEARSLDRLEEGKKKLIDLLGKPA
jgi:phosphomannomutase